jgi:hypothetical protein
MAELRDEITELITTGRSIQAFDRALAALEWASHAQREESIRPMLLKSLTSAGGVSWNDISTCGHLNELCFELLDRIISHGRDSVVAGCIFQLLAEPRITWIDGSNWRPKSMDFLRHTVLDANLSKLW